MSESKARIPPVIGRHVWYWPDGRAPAGYNPDYPMDATQPYAAIIVRVNGPETVNLTVFDPDGYPSARHNVPLLQEGDWNYDNAMRFGGYSPGFATWMPYQVGQAKAAAS